MSMSTYVISHDSVIVLLPTSFLNEVLRRGDPGVAAGRHGDGAIYSVIRKFTRNRKIYPNEDSAIKLVFMAISEAAKKWTMPIHHLKEALNHFAIMFEKQMPESISK